MSFPAGFLRAFALVACAWHASAVRAQEQPLGAPAQRPLVSISVQETKDGTRWSVLSAEASLDELVRGLARKAGLALEGAEVLPLGARVSVELAARPLDQVLAYVLGAHGLVHEIAAGTLRVAPVPADPAALLGLAEGAWRAVEAGGDARATGQARLAQASLAAARGDLEGAYRVYAELAEGETGAHAHEATFRAGRVLQRLGHWAEAAQHFRTLAGREGAEAFHSRARLELARVSIELGDPESALHVLNFLETNHAAADAVERAERRLVRARALVATREFVEALRTLEEGDFAAATGAEARALEIRAAAFEGLGFDVEAARAWLIFAREAADAGARAAAFEKAAALSLAAGDELGTLFVCREAAKAGADSGLGALVRAARLRLGLDEEDAPTTINERLALAEELLARDELARAAELFEGLYLARGALAELDQARVLAGWARIALGRAGLDAAIEVLSRARTSFEDPQAVQRLDLAAAALFEDEGRYEDAAEAYRGNY